MYRAESLLSLLRVLLQFLANIDAIELDLSCPAWQAAAPEARELVSAMLAKDPCMRPSAQQLLDGYSGWLKCGCLANTEQ